MIKRLRGKENLINLGLILAGVLGLYLIVAWASYSPLDNAWSVGSTLGDKAVINKTGDNLPTQQLNKAPIAPLKSI